jgi:ATP-dependent Clp protease ATP-binding subunit ClpB
LSDPARDLLAREGYDPVYGARPLKRVIQKQLTDVLARKIVEGTFQNGDALIAQVQDSKLTILKAGG